VDCSLPLLAIVEIHGKKAFGDIMDAELLQPFAKYRKSFFFFFACPKKKRKGFFFELLWCTTLLG
jgi:hypothetical protein